MRRADWIVFDRYSAPTPVAVPVQPVSSPAVPVAAPAVPVQEMPKRVERPAAQGRSLEERLILLNDLKQKGLITDEEFRAKRLKILDEI
ncbi:SHOCT domain-containing protein [bacterium]|nr:SHOCT domain-containing protein [bacterium]